MKKFNLHSRGKKRKKENHIHTEGKFHSIFDLHFMQPSGESELFFLTMSKKFPKDL